MRRDRRSGLQYVLFGRVSELILAPPVIALLNAGVGPQRFNRFHIWQVERGHSFVVDGADELSVCLRTVSG